MAARFPKHADRSAASPGELITLETLHFLASRIRRSRIGRRYQSFWHRVDPAWQKTFVRLRRRRGLLTYINNDAFRLEHPWGSLYGRHAPREYEPHAYRAFADSLRPGMVVFDVGAHVGFYTLAAANRVGRYGRVYACEPSPAAAAVLRRHVALNDWEDRVDVIEAAASDHDGKAVFYMSGVTSAASLARTNAEALNREHLPEPIRGIEVRTITLDRECDERQAAPDVVKIDAEGAELQVLHGMRRLLETSSPVIFCEVHPRQMSNFGASVSQLEEFLAMVGYEWQILDPPNDVGIFHWRIARREVSRT